MVKERTVASRTVFDGRLLRVEELEVELEGGLRSFREIVRHPGAAVILPQLPDGRFVLVRQFRKPVEQDLVEAVAGTLDPGESPEVCAARELKEETGYEAEEFVKLGEVYPAPGYTDEKLHLFFARLLPVAGESSPDDDEHLSLLHVSAADIEAMIADGRMCDAKTLATWHLYRNRGA